MMLKIVMVVLCLGSSSLPLGMAQEKSSQPAPANATEKQTAQTPSKAPSAKPQALSEEESSELSQRAEEPGREVSGGALSNLHLTYIVIALAAAVLVLVLK